MYVEIGGFHIFLRVSGVKFFLTFTWPIITFPGMTCCPKNIGTDQFSRFAVFIHRKTEKQASKIYIHSHNFVIFFSLFSFFLNKKFFN